VYAVATVSRRIGIAALRDEVSPFLAHATSLGKIRGGYSVVEHDDLPNDRRGFNTHVVTARGQDYGTLYTPPPFVLMGC